MEIAVASEEYISLQCTSTGGFTGDSPVCCQGSRCLGGLFGDSGVNGATGSAATLFLSSLSSSESFSHSS